MSAIHEDHYQLIIDRLIQARKDANITQIELAKIWGKAQPTIVKLEQKERRLDVGEFLELCSILDVSPTEIITAAHKLMKQKFFKK